jgi:CRP-like cAMP-binding protein
MEQLIQNYEQHTEVISNQRSHKKGEVIYHESTPTFGFYYVQSGTIKIFTTDSNGREVILRLAKTGDIFGHGYLFGEKTHTDSAKAVETTSCQFLDGNQFSELMMKKPDMGMAIMKKIGKEINLYQTRCVDLIKKNVRERLACYFHYMAEHHSMRDASGIKILLQLSREEIASMIGTANETAIRFISEFKELGLIREEDRYFHILNPEKLASIGRLH